MAELKTKKNAGSVLKFLDSIENPQRREDGKKLLALYKKALGLKPIMWGTSIVGFGQYHYKSERSSQEGDWPRSGFSPRKQSLTVYVMPGFSKLQPLLKKLGKHKVSGGSCIYINKLTDIHEPTLIAIIKASHAEMNKRYPTK